MKIKNLFTKFYLNLNYDTHRKIKQINLRIIDIKK